jgi:hypothetical protein
MPSVFQRDLSDVLIWATWGSSILFAIVYHLMLPKWWWRSPMGRNIMGFDLSLAGVLTPGVIALMTGVNRFDNQWIEWTQLTIFVAVPLLTLNRIRLLFKVQKDTNDTNDTNGVDKVPTKEE